jgi:hypothetical protein
MAKKKELDERSLRHLATIADYKATFSSPHGKKVLRDIMKNCGFDITSFVEKDPYATCFNEGQRSVIITIFKRLKTDLKELEELMLKSQGE